MTRESLVCPGCSCLCDDLDVTLENGRITAVANVCLWGTGKFLSTKKFRNKSPRGRLTAFQVRRRERWQEVRYEEAIERAAALLAQAQRPLIYGLTNSGVWAQNAALNLARRLMARLEPADLAFMSPFYAAIQAHGLFWAPLEVIRDEADTVLFWGANPIHSAPRHLVRYAVFARGRFTERGLEDRRVAAVDIYSTELEHFCRPFVMVQPSQELALAAGIAARLTGEGDGATVPGAAELADFLAQTAYGVMFLGRGVSYGPGRELVERLAALVAWLNRERPFNLLPLPGDFNSAGLYHLLLHELGSPGAPDFGAGGEAVNHLTPVDFQEVDAILVSGADLFWFLQDEQVQDLKRRQVPLVVLSPFANRTTAQAAVLFPVALEGVEVDEEAYRLDGLPVPLRGLTSSPWPAAHRILADLALFC
jgi:formylmethanofuran dehydrogenase subunit B